MGSVRRGHSEEKRLDEGGGRGGGHETEADAQDDEHQRLSHDEPDDTAHAGPERTPSSCCLRATSKARTEYRPQPATTSASTPKSVNIDAPSRHDLSCESIWLLSERAFTNRIRLDVRVVSALRDASMVVEPSVMRAMIACGGPLNSG